MYVTKSALSRRTVLRGLGATLSLPLLDAMVPALTALSRTAATPAKRFGVVSMPNGVILKNFLPTTVGRDFEILPMVKPVEAFRDHLTIVTGLANAQGDPLDASSGPHSRVNGCWLSGVRIKRTERADISAGTTIDQYAADELGKDTPLRSLELALEPNFVVGNCEGGYSCSYINTFSWRTPRMPLPMETNPRIVFERLFGDETGQARLEQAQLDRSILDSVRSDLLSIQQTLGPGDRTTISDYLEAIRDVERRIQQAERQDDAIVPEDRPLGIPPSFADHATLMFDLMLLAYRADITRVATFQLARELSLRSYPELGVPEAHHDISHHGEEPDKVAKKAKIDIFHMDLVSHLVKGMASTPDGDGSLLDHSILLVGGSMGDGNLHRPHNLPIMLFGRAGRESGRHVKAASDTPFMNLGLSLLDKFGVHLDQIGDSTGRVAEI